MLFKRYYIMYNKLIAKQSAINHKLPLQNQTILIKLIYCDIKMSVYVGEHK